MKSVCVFCGSSAGARPDYLQAARGLGETLARRGLVLVYGGSTVGLMGALADAALGAGGQVVGVIPRALQDWEIAHRGLTELHVVASMHERKQKMSDLADAFVALPGGYGTLDELAEVLTWSQLGLHRKPSGLLDVAGFFGPLVAHFDMAVTERFIHPEHRRMLVVDDQPEALLDRLAAHQPPPVDKWLDRYQR